MLHMLLLRFKSWDMFRGSDCLLLQQGVPRLVCLIFSIGCTLIHHASPSQHGKTYARWGPFDSILQRRIVQNLSFIFNLWFKLCCGPFLAGNFSDDLEIPTPKSFVYMWNLILRTGSRKRVAGCLLALLQIISPGAWPVF